MTLRSLPVHLGIDEWGEPVVWDAVKDEHMMVVGSTGSGKSMAAYNILGTLAGHFGSVRVCGIDASSVLLNPFRERFPDPWITLSRDRGFHEKSIAVLHEIVHEMDVRDAKFTRQDKFDVFGPTRPLIVVVLEEFPAFKTALELADKASGAKVADRLAPEAARLVNRLVSEGRKYGIRVVLIAQRPDAEILGGATREQIPTRVALRMSSLDGYKMAVPTLAAEEVKAAAELPEGAGFVVTAGRAHRRFRGPFFDGGYEIYLDRIESTRPKLTRDVVKVAPWSRDE